MPKALPQTAKEILLQTFGMFERNAETVVPIVDQLLVAAATRALRIEIRPTPAERLVVTLSQGETFEVSIPGGLSAFRAMLARIGVVCSAAAEKRSIAGKAKARLRRWGMVSDKRAIERRNQTVEYVSAVIREQPGSPLYKVDADLDVKPANGTMTLLHVTMQNELRGLFLLIESRKADIISG